MQVYQTLLRMRGSGSETTEMGAYKCELLMKYVIQYSSMETLAAIHFKPRVYLLAVLQFSDT